MEIVKKKKKKLKQNRVAKFHLRNYGVVRIPIRLQNGDDVWKRWKTVKK